LGNPWAWNLGCFALADERSLPRHGSLESLTLARPVAASDVVFDAGRVPAKSCLFELDPQYRVVFMPAECRRNPASLDLDPPRIELFLMPAECRRNPASLDWTPSIEYQALAMAQAILAQAVLSRQPRWQPFSAGCGPKRVPTSQCCCRPLPPPAPRPAVRRTTCHRLRVVHCSGTSLKLG
jgi:hypothetical protein